MKTKINILAAMTAAAVYTPPKHTTIILDPQDIPEPQDRRDTILPARSGKTPERLRRQSDWKVSTGKGVRK